MKTKTVELIQTDLDGLIQTLAGRLRGSALALEGYQATLHMDGTRDPAMDGVRESLEWDAKLLAAVGDSLCQECRLASVSEQVRLEAPAPKGKATSRAS